MIPVFKLSPLESSVLVSRMSAGEGTGTSLEAKLFPQYLSASNGSMGRTVCYGKLVYIPRLKHTPSRLVLDCFSVQPTPYTNNDNTKFNFSSSLLATTLTLSPISTPQKVAMPLVYPPIIYKGASFHLSP